MEITNEVLAAYAAGKVSEEARKAVRRYLTEHPEELETVMRCMDKDCDLTLDSKDRSTAAERGDFNQRLEVLLKEVTAGQRRRSSSDSRPMA